MRNVFVTTILRGCLAIGAMTGVGMAQQRAARIKPISLAGQWRFTLDPNKEGVKQQFFHRELPGRITLPGSIDEAKLGTPNPNKPTLDGLYQPFRYEGPAWYQRDIELPRAWVGKQVSLFLERTHWDTAVWIDNHFAGTQDSLIAPHVYDLGTTLTAGKHRLTIRVDNTRKIDLGPFVSVNYAGTQTNWNGLIGKLELRAKDPVSLGDVEVYPGVDRQLAKVSAVVNNLTGKAVTGQLKLLAIGPSGTGTVPEGAVNFMAANAQTTVRAELPMGKNVRLWDEFSPALYHLTVSMEASSSSRTFTDDQTVDFGMRKFATRGTQFTMNGRPIFLRGTLECAIFPLTGYPPTDVPSWRRIYRIIKSYGLNFIRFHSWCPPDAAFAAADSEGVMVQAEGPQANVPAGVDKQRDAFVEQELMRMVRTYGNHPSFCLMTLGNEYGGADSVAFTLGGHADQRRSSPSLLLGILGADTANRQFTESDRPRGVQGPGTDADFREAIAKQDRPLMGHEIGQWTFYPNFDGTSKYTGVLAARNFDLIRDDLASKHLLDLAPSFVQATGQAGGAALQGGNRDTAAHSRPRRLLAARSARLSGPRYRGYRAARSVLGFEGLHRSGGTPAILRPDRTPAAHEEADFHHGGDVRGAIRYRPLRSGELEECAAGVVDVRRQRSGNCFGGLCGPQRAHRKADAHRHPPVFPHESPSPRQAQGDGRA